MSAQLTFEIYNQLITRTDNYQPVAKSQNFLRAAFTFESDWGNADKIAIFQAGRKTYEVILDDNNECTVPWEVLTHSGNFFVSVYSGDRITATKVPVLVLPTGYTDKVDTPQDPSVDVYSALIGRMDSIDEHIEEFVEEAVEKIAAPTKTSELINDSGFITSDDVPIKTSELTNDSGFVTEEDVPNKTSELVNDSDFITHSDIPEPVTPNWNSTSSQDGYIENKPDIKAGTGTDSITNSHSTAIGDYSSAMGYNTEASGECASTDGIYTEASGAASSAKGFYTRATHKSQVVFGEHNVPDPSENDANSKGTYVEIVGNGTARNAKSNARTLDWNGNEWIKGNFKMGGNSYDDPNAKEIATKEYVDEHAGTGSVKDVKVNGTSIVDSETGGAEIPMATANVPGVIRPGAGLMVDGSYVVVSKASGKQVKAGALEYSPIVPNNQHYAAFYGLAKAAGADMKDSANAVGTYTDEAKEAIRTMLGAGSVKDVKINGTSIVNSETGEAEIPIASANTLGVVRTRVGDNGLQTLGDGYLATYPATSADIKGGVQVTRPVTSKRLNEAAFYGLAKAAGDTTQSQSSNAVGTYTDDAKAAIKAMLGVADSTQTVAVSGTDPIITALPNTRYVCGEVYSLSFTPSEAGICEVVFTSSSTVTVLTLPSTVKMPEWWEGPESGYTYEINIVDGVYGAVTRWQI